AAIERWIAELDSDRFAVRDNASRELANAGSLAEPALKQALLKLRSVEAERRIRQLLGRVAGPPSAWLQAHRALEVLERSGDQAARQVLLHLTREAPQEWMRQDARQALLRLERRPGQ